MASLDRKSLRIKMPWSQRSATGQGWEDAAAGKKNNNPHKPHSFKWDCYEKGYTDFLSDKYRDQPPLTK